MTRILRYLVLGGVAMSGLSWATPAAAYCRTMSCQLGEDEVNDPCEKKDGCVSEGAPVHWPNPCLTYAVQLDGSPELHVEGDQVLELVRQGFAIWQTAQCPGGGTPRFEATFQGMLTCHQRESVCGGVDANVNVVMFHDDSWPGKSTDLGVTTPAGGSESGKLVDADIEFHTEHLRVIGAADPSSRALLTVVAHEIGHFLGLSHSTAAGALMSEGYESIAMSGGLLTADDIAGICAAYPPGKPLSCEATLPAYDACQLEARGTEPNCEIASTSDSQGCSVGAKGRDGSGGMRALLASLVLCGLGARVRRRRRPPLQRAVRALHK